MRLLLRLGQMRGDVNRVREGRLHVDAGWCYRDRVLDKGTCYPEFMERERTVLYRSLRSHEELHSFVASFGARCARAATRCRLENVVLRAVSASRGDPSLARMLPVFLWRVRKDLDLDDLASRAARGGQAQVLGYYLDVVDNVAPARFFSRTVRTLRRGVQHGRPVFLFPETAKYPFEAHATRESTPAHARRWGLLVRTPLDGYRSYFERVAPL